MERNKLKEAETNFLVSESKKNPELFGRDTFIDSPDFLEKIGIFFTDSKDFPQGYLKLWPQDFIVEEESMFGSLETVDMGEFLHPEKPFSPTDPTIYATLVKCELPTFEATKNLAKVLNVDMNLIKSAGIKDSDALTSQLISIRGGNNIENLKKIESPYYFLKNVFSGKGSVEIGSLKANKFTVLIRTNADFDKEQFQERLEKVKKEGFYNFYYLQRFANPRFVNWFWGLLMLRGDYRNAVFSFLCSEGEREIQYFKNIRGQIKENLENWDKVAEILKPFPLVMQNEMKVVSHLQRNPKDFVGALKQIPEQIQLWVFAYSSLLFNRKVSEYAYNETPIPDELPIIISPDKNDWLPYFDYLKEDQIFGMPIKNLEPFNKILLKKRTIKTKIMAEIHKVEFLPEGVAMSFTLPKGCYATTFLAHFFQLASGRPLQGISENVLDIKKILNQGSLEGLDKKFQQIIYSKLKDIFSTGE